jgi:hypothetical protein
MSRTPITLLLPSIAIIIGLRIWMKQELLPDPEQVWITCRCGLIMLGWYLFVRWSSELGSEIVGESAVPDVFLQIMIWALALFVFLFAVAQVVATLHEPRRASRLR